MAKDVSKRLKFAPDYILNQEMAKNCGLTSYYEQCLHVLNRIDQLGLRKEEHIFLKAIIVSNCDTQLDDVLQLHKLKDDLLASLHDTVAVIRCGNPLIHIQNLLLLLPSIGKAGLMIRKFWKDVYQSGQVKLHKNLIKMLDFESCDI
jgi:estrogen-related receptor ERR